MTQADKQYHVMTDLDGLGGQLVRAVSIAAHTKLSAAKRDAYRRWCKRGHVWVEYADGGICWDPATQGSELTGCL